MEAVDCLAWASVLLTLTFALSCPHLFLVACILLCLGDRLVGWALGAEARDQLLQEVSSVLKAAKVDQQHTDVSGPPPATWLDHRDLVMTLGLQGDSGMGSVDALHVQSIGPHSSVFAPQGDVIRAKEVPPCRMSQSTPDLTKIVSDKEGCKEQNSKPHKDNIRRSLIPRPIQTNKQSSSKEKDGEISKSSDSEKATPKTVKDKDKKPQRSLSSSRDHLWKRECKACDRKAMVQRSKSEERPCTKSLSVVRPKKPTAGRGTSVDEDKRSNISKPPWRSNQETMREKETPKPTGRSSRDSMKGKETKGTRIRSRSEGQRSLETATGIQKQSRLAMLKGSHLSLAGSTGSVRDRKVSFGSTSELGCGVLWGGSCGDIRSWGKGGKGVRICFPDHKRALSLENLHHPFGKRTFSKSLHTGSGEDLRQLGKSTTQPKRGANLSQSVESLCYRRRAQSQDRLLNGSCDDLTKRESGSSSCVNDDDQKPATVRPVSQQQYLRRSRSGSMMSSCDGLHIGPETFFAEVHEEGQEDSISSPMDEEMELGASTINLHYTVGPIVHLDSSSDVQIGHGNVIQRDPVSPTSTNSEEPDNMDQTLGNTCKGYNANGDISYDVVETFDRDDHIGCHTPRDFATSNMEVEGHQLLGITTHEGDHQSRSTTARRRIGTTSTTSRKRIATSSTTSRKRIRNTSSTSCKRIGTTSTSTAISDSEHDNPFTFRGSSTETQAAAIGGMGSLQDIQRVSCNRVSGYIEAVKTEKGDELSKYRRTKSTGDLRFPKTCMKQKSVIEL